MACATSVEAPAASVIHGDVSGTPDRSHETEVVVIGSGLGGLCCAAMLATYGVKVFPSHAAANQLLACCFGTAMHHCSGRPGLDTNVLCSVLLCDKC